MLPKINELHQRLLSENSSRSRYHSYILCMLILIMPICGFSIDLYTPFLPKISQLFNATDILGKFSVSIYIFGFGSGQIFFGYRSDKQGRRKTLIESLILFILLSILISWTTSIYYFLLLRLIQGITVAGLIINVRSLVVDLFHGIALRKASIYITTAWMVSPIIGPAIGGYFYVHYTWHAAFYFLSAYAGIALLFTYIFIPETNYHRIDYSYKSALLQYKSVILSKTFMKNAYGLTIAFTIINLINVLGPYLIEKQLGYSPLIYVYIVLTLGLACFIGSLANTLLLRFLSINQVIKFSLIFSTLIGIIGLAFAVYLPDNIFLMIAICASTMCLIGAIYPNYSINCSSLFKHIAGTAAAVRGITTMIGASVITGLISILPIHSVTIFLMIYPILTASSLVIFYIRPSSSKSPYVNTPLIDSNMTQ